jgi:hypothetical protein
MSLMDSRAILSRAAKELFLRWEDMKIIWSDAQSQEFEKVYLSQIEQDVRSALGALDQMGQVVQSIESDCG